MAVRQGGERGRREGGERLGRERREGKGVGGWGVGRRNGGRAAR